MPGTLSGSQSPNEGVLRDECGSVRVTPTFQRWKHDPVPHLLRTEPTRTLRWKCSISHVMFLFPPSAEVEPAQPAQSKTGKYVPPSLRDGSTRRGESMQPNRRGSALGYRSNHFFSSSFIIICTILTVKKTKTLWSY